MLEKWKMVVQLLIFEKRLIIINESKKYLQTTATLNCSEAYNVSDRNTAPQNNLSFTE